MMWMLSGLLLQGLAQVGPPPAPPPPPPPLPPQGRSEPARARANLGSLISNDDYPAEALRNEQEGTVGFRLHVGADGRVTACDITSSSGHALLDSTTCRLMTERARFSPARDRKGRPTLDAVSARIVWRIEEGPEPYRMEPRLLVVTLAVTPEGAVSCSVTVNGKAMKTGTCPDPVEGMISTARNSGRTAEQTMVEIVAPEGETAPSDPGGFGERFVDAEVRLKVAADGTVLECRVERLVTFGNEDSDDPNGPCEPFAPGSKAFAPAAAGGPAREVTVTTRLYGRS